jgi:hypothetical protein
VKRFRKTSLIDKHVAELKGILGGTLQNLPSKLLSFRVVCEKDRINVPGQKAGNSLPKPYRAVSDGTEAGVLLGDNNSNNNSNSSIDYNVREKNEHCIGIVMNAGGVEGRHMILNFVTVEEEKVLIQCIDRLLELTGIWFSLRFVCCAPGIP